MLSVSKYVCRVFDVCVVCFAHCVWRLMCASGSSCVVIRVSNVLCVLCVLCGINVKCLERRVCIVRHIRLCVLCGVCALCTG